MMNKNEKFVITINRELGSGGRTVGQKLAEKLGVEYYDKAVIKALQEKYHLTVEEIEKRKGESDKWWAEAKRILNISTSVVGNGGYYQAMMADDSSMLTTDEMFRSETEILKGIAEAESCVIAGRSGFYVFRDHPNRLSILIQASMPFRVERVSRKQHGTPEQARHIIDKVDEMRENYVKKYTKSSRYDTRNYDLMISADGKTEDEIVELILKYIG